MASDSARFDATRLDGRRPQVVPEVVLVPGFPEGSAHDWMAAWEAQRTDTRRVDLGMWDKPHRNTWVNKLNLAIRRADRPVLLVAHDIGCLAAVWWAEYEQPGPGDPVIGALLVAPPDVDRPGSDPRLAPFGACPTQPLPFPSLVVADRRASQSQQVTATRLASDWGSLFTQDEIDGHGWSTGQYLLGRLLRAQPEARRTTAGAGLRENGPAAPAARQAVRA